ncbi:MAG: sulfatase [Myxococcales bacterium]|nr:sulfatase [Myxococcales bacterium]
MKRSPGRGAGWIADGLLVVGLAVYLLGLALCTATSAYDAADVAGFAVIYALLALTLYAGSLWLACVAALPGLLACLGVGALLVWHLREQAMVPGRPAAFAVAAVGMGFAFFLAVRLRSRDWRANRLAVIFALVATLFVVTLVTLFHTSNDIRWHLLRHNKLLGTPAYYLIANDVEAMCEELWAERRAQRDEGSGTLAALPSRGPTATRPPNIVFVLIDTLRADALAAYGGDPHATPELNRFAQESVVFTNVLANASWTRPSVASFFTGLLPEEHGAVDRGDRLPDEQLTLAESLRSYGYSTTAFVTNFAAVGRGSGFAQGFDEFHQLPAGAHAYARAEDVNRAVRGWLARRSVGKEDGWKPLFLYVHYLDPHTPYLSGGPEARSHGEARESYDAEVRYVDRAVGGLLDNLRRQLPEPTVVVVTSDHGEEFGEHGERGHGYSLYREAIWLPTIVHIPGGEADEISAPLEARDFFDLLVRVAASGSVDPVEWAKARARSRRYASIYSTTASAVHRPYLSHVCMRSIEEDGLRLVWSGYGSTYELYDLTRDPDERRSLARALPDRVEALEKSIDDPVSRWVERVPVEEDAQTVEMLRVLGYVE